MNRRYLPIGILFLSLNASAEFCASKSSSSKYRLVKPICDLNGLLIEEEIFSTSSETKLEHKIYQNEDLIKQTFFSNNKASRDRRWQYLENDKVIVSEHKLPEDVTTRYETSVKGQLVSARIYDRYKDYKFTHIEFYNKKGIVLKKEQVNSLGLVYRSIFYSYDEGERKPYAFKIQNLDGEETARYSLKKIFNFDEIYKDENSESYQRKLEHFQDASRLKISIIDSGVDIFHPELAYKMWNNPLDQINGIDDDGNGYIDDLMGWAEPSKSGFPLETISIRDVAPNSHGTHTASIATRDLEGVAIIPFVGDYGESFFLDKMRIEFKSKNIEFANMSFSFPHWKHGDIPKTTIFSLKRLIVENPQTLFFAAAGNDKRRIANNHRQGAYPATFNMDNIVSVGAINTDHIIESKMHEYTMAEYSNYSAMSVDIFAPGTKVNAASFGGGLIRHTGTSMATPYALRESANIKLKYPSLSALELKEIILKSAYIPSIDEPMQSTSGGMIFPRRAMEVAKRYVESKLTIEEVVLSVRSEKEYNLKGESSSLEYMQKLLKMWSIRIRI